MQWHPVEWDSFFKNTKILADESNMFNGQNPFGGSDEKSGNAKTTDDLLFYCVGFKSSAPEFTLRTRILASFRVKTLYRTVSSMMNYAKAINILIGYMLLDFSGYVLRDRFVYHCIY